MRWLRKKHKQAEPTKALIVQAPDEPVVNLDREYVPINNEKDPTSLLLSLSMKHGPVYLRFDSGMKKHVVTIGKDEWTGNSQLEALRNARKELDTPS